MLYSLETAFTSQLIRHFGACSACNQAPWESSWFPPIRMYHINMLHVCDEPRQIFSVTLSIRYYLSTLLGRINDSILFQVIFFYRAMLC